MRRLWPLVCAAFLGLGCASDADKAAWAEVWRDLRGDNQKMRNDFAGPQVNEGKSLRPD
jgi:hypothetical protein